VDKQQQSLADSKRVYRVLIIDPVGLARSGADIDAVVKHIRDRSAHFHLGEVPADAIAGVHFSYQPELHDASEIESVATAYDGVIAAATPVPEQAEFPEGGVRIGAGTNNMASLSWGGSAGRGGNAPLMNTPGLNSVATAQLVFKALLRVQPDLPIEALHERVCENDFDTARDLRDFATHRLAGQRIAVLGFGNIGRGVARLAQAFRMQVVVYARAHWRRWVEAEGFEFADTAVAAARDANVLSVHLGLGAPLVGVAQDGYANNALVGDAVLSQLSMGATLINFDRGELVDVDALEVALRRGQIAHAAIDADVFQPDRDNPSTLTGPMAAYLKLVERYRHQLMLLPHAAADTDHPSRVAGAVQAINQMLAAIHKREVHNLIGDLPAGYQDAGPVSVAGVTARGAADLALLAGATERLAALREQLAQLDAQLTRLEKGVVLSSSQAEACVLAATQVSTQIEQLGLRGPYRPMSSWDGP